jgi:hypothetical protein
MINMAPHADELSILAIPPSRIDSLQVGFVNEGDEKLLQEVLYIEIKIK